VAGSGVRTTLVSPGPVNTPLWDEVNPGDKPGFLPRSAMLGPDAVASAVTFAIQQPSDVNIDELRLSRA
jgi:NADP-dependent 3-hydroxy acid dehydrogenase YdfG